MTSEQESRQDASQLSLMDIQMMLGDRDISILNLQKRVVLLETALNEKQEVIDNLTSANKLVSKEE